MIRGLVIRLIAVLLIVNGIAGIMAAWVGWRVSTDLLDGLRQSGATVTGQQARLVETVRGVAVGVDDAAQAAVGLSRSTTQVRNSVTDASRATLQLASTFDRLSQASQVTVFGVRPLEGLVEPFSANAADFRQLSVSLEQTADSLAGNVREMTRVGDDLKSIHGQLSAAAVEVEVLPAATLIQQALAGMELGSRLLLGMIFFEATLSALTGLALLMMVGTSGTGQLAPLSSGEGAIDTPGRAGTSPPGHPESTPEP
jgi:hypothetical protein